MNRFLAVSVLIVLAVAASCNGQAKVSIMSVCFRWFNTMGDIVEWKDSFLGVEFYPCRSVDVRSGHA